jgi:TM2 domain-containing membrane protein YozV
MPTVVCPKCSESITVADDRVGEIHECPNCGTTVEIHDLPASSLPDSTKYCHECGASIRKKASICPECGVRQPDVRRKRSGDPVLREANGKKMAAGLCGIFLGAFGIHKYILGMNKAGTLMLLVTVLSCGIGYAVTHIIGLIEGIIYLTKSDEEFYELYIVEKKEWF